MKLTRSTVVWVVLAVLVAIAVGITGGFHARSFWRGYLCAWLIWLAMPIGALGLLLLHLVTGGRWGWSFRGPALAASLTLPLFALLFVPLTFVLDDMYEWAGPGPFGSDVQNKLKYLNPTWFLLRTGAFFLWWTLVVLWLSRATRWLDRRPDDHATERAVKVVAPVGLSLYVVSMSILGVDLVASVQVDWYSSIFGLLFIFAEGLAALAFLVFVARQPEDRDERAELTHDLGTLVFAFVFIHAYLAYAQGYIIWIGDVPHTTSWYLVRQESPWGGIALAIIFLIFGIPLLGLMARLAKRLRPWVLTMCVLILAGHALNVAWSVLPDPGHPIDAGTFLFPAGLAFVMGVIWLAAFGLVRARIVRAPEEG